MRIKDVISALEEFAPPSFQESYDNAGLITGDPNWEVTGAIVCLDSIEAVLDEAIAKGCNLIIAHHPIVFRELKRLTGKNYVERTIIKAIKNDLALYAIHTNLDNVIAGVNHKFAERLGLQNTRILAPKSGLLRKLHTFCPDEHTPAVMDALFAAGAGNIGDYDECSFRQGGTGTFRGGESSNPFVGEKGERHQESEQRLEVVFPAHRQRQVERALMKAHPYEEVAYDIVALENSWDRVGSGLVGELPEPMSETQWLAHLKERMHTGCIRHTALLGQEVKTVAVCGGAGGFLLGAAKGAGAQFFVTADYKYHEFFDADGKVVIADIGHYESEQFTSELLRDFLREKFPTFAVRLTEVNTNPINYF